MIPACGLNQPIPSVPRHAMQRWYRAVVCVLAFAFVCRADASNADTVNGNKAARPNILLIVADDLGWADVGFHGGRIETPVLDKLAHTGVELDQHYVQPVCTPTRTALMSGRYPSRFGPQAQAPSNLRAMPLGTVTLASALKSVGYSTYVCGKWHLGSREEWSPNHYGFDHSYGSLVGAVDPWTHQYRRGEYAKTWHRDGKRLDEEGNATELVARQAEAWIREKRGPWLVYVPFHAVHVPIDTPEQYKQRYAGRKFEDDPAKDESFHRFAAFVMQLDAKIGALVKAVDETGQRDNTLIVFTSDNGGKLKSNNPYIGSVADSPLLSSNGPLRGEKAQLYEGGIRVAAFANWPAKLAPRKVTTPMHCVDWMPTLTSLAGYTPSAELRWDGRDVWPTLTGEVAKPEPRSFYIALRNAAAVRDGDWKLIVGKDGKRELFNLAADPYEKEELSQREPMRVAALEKQFVEFRQSDITELPEDLRGLKD